MSRPKNVKALVLTITDLDLDRLEKIQCELLDKLHDMKDSSEGFFDSELTDWDCKIHKKWKVKA
jgi:hypothetical protein